jgi:PAS domain S-box-containing protein
LLDEQGHLHNGASPSLSKKYLQAIENLKADPNIGTCSAAAATGRLVVTPDITSDPKWHGLAHLSLAQGFKSAWAMPITARDGRVLGTFGSYFRERREPSAAERQTVEILARTAALAIEGKQLEEELRRSENQLRLIADTIPLLISFVDRDQHYRFVNQTYIDWFGKPAEQIIGRHLSETIGKDAYRELLPEIEKVLAGEKVVFERLVPYKSGERFAHVDYIPKFDSSSGQVTGFYVFVQDITEQKNTQEELRRSRDDLETRVAQRTRELEESNQARIKVLQQLVTVQEDERRRIARDLHDQLGQQMTALRLNLEILKKMCGGDDALYKQVDETQKVARQIDADVDFLAWQMRPATLDDLGIVAALEHYVGQWSKNFKISAKFDADRFGETQVNSEVETNLYRIAQESLNNIYKHAQASRVNVFLEAVDDFAALIIEDDGVGFEKDEQAFGGKRAQGIGLIGMRERAALVGGSLEIESAKGAGTTVYAKFPVLPGE